MAELERRDFPKVVGLATVLPGYADIVKELKTKLIRLRTKYEDEDSIIIAL
jgi:F0F1-type ATP synthase epsilon subunit